MKPAPPKVSAEASKVPDHEADDSETLTDRAYRLVEELIVTLALPPETILSDRKSVV